MAPQSSTLPWKIPWTEEPGRLQSMGGHLMNSTSQRHGQCPGSFCTCERLASAGAHQTLQTRRLCNREDTALSKIVAVLMRLSCVHPTCG